MLIGADIEFFVKTDHGDIVPAYDIINRDRNNPINFKNTNLYYDNILLEFNITPCYSEQSFVNTILNSIWTTQNYILPNKLDFSAAIRVPKNILTSKKSNNFGCEIDYNAYEHIPCTNSISDSNIRTTGGHIHLSGTNNDVIQDKKLYPIFVYMLDLFLANSLTVIETENSQALRRTFYGRAGCYRIKPYGIEYRVLSSWWTLKQKYISLVYKICEFVFEFMNDQMWKKFWNIDEDKINSGNLKNAYECFGYDSNDLQETINLCDSYKAEKYFNFASNFLPNQICKEIYEYKKNKGS